MSTFHTIPTVEFDSSQVTEEVKADLRKNIELIEGIDQKHFDQIYDAALRSVAGGRNLYLLTQALIQMNINGMTKARAGQIASSLNSKATATINRIKQQSLGITEAIWRYSGVPCEVSPKNPGQQDSAHKAADGKLYKVDTGMFLNGTWTWPGYEDGCRCGSKSVIKGFV
ncbi:hypothetical protein RP726_17610 [Candidatus Methylospira mobilis]|uniref:hypothetical protein n=1 Tax=Candidatus Methylospira mobilis TaxID=1808979 RepID=UPI0028E6F3B0|nr:hypothetical protein [Candidatus Methylospira mobilis]WNV04207.1 hypothetical protein RP726_17610 [Candidatus Methylospira mobilis]